jgi:hypothetical protein
MVDTLSLYFGRKARKGPRKGKKSRRGKASKRVARKSPGRKPKRGHMVRKLSKSKAYVVVAGRKRKLYRGKNGAIYYRTKSGRSYVPASVLRRKGHVLSPKRKRRSSKAKRKARKSKKKSSKKRKLLQTKAAKKRRALYRKAKRSRKSRFGEW